jgi:hypothetical protein
MSDSVEITLRAGNPTQLHPDHVKGQCFTPGCPEPTAHWMNKGGFLAFICCDCWKLKKEMETRP